MRFLSVRAERTGRPARVAESATRLLVVPLRRVWTYSGAFHGAVFEVSTGGAPGPGGVIA